MDAPPAPDPPHTDQAGLPHVAPVLAQRLLASGLRPLQMAGRTLLPLVQGGMGVGISAHRLLTPQAALAAA